MSPPKFRRGRILKCQAYENHHRHHHNSGHFLHLKRTKLSLELILDRLSLLVCYFAKKIGGACLVYHSTDIFFSNLEDHKHLFSCRGIWKGLSFGTGNLSAIIYRQKHWLSAKAEAGFELQDLASSPNPAINSSDTERVAFTGLWFHYLTNEKFEPKMTMVSCVLTWCCLVCPASILSYTVPGVKLTGSRIGGMDNFKILKRGRW